ncbi:MFS transporter [bacterium]|nr:MAG: MFS transporter [bacterium]
MHASSLSLFATGNQRASRARHAILVKPMRTYSRYTVLALTVIVQAAISLVQQGFGSIVPFIAVALALDHAHVGLAVAATSAGSAAFTALSGVAVDYFGERAIILSTGLCSGLALIAAAAFANFEWLVLCLFLFGVAYGASTPAGGRAILLWFTHNRGFAMGIRQTGVPIGGLCGALLLPLIAAHAGYRWSLAAGGLICIGLSTAAALAYRSPDGADAAASPHLRALLRGMLRIARSPRSIYVNLTCGVLVSAQYAVLSFLVLSLIARAHTGIALAAAALAVAQAGAAGGRLLWGALSDKLFDGDRMLPMALICVLSAVTLWWLAALTGGSTALILSVALLLGLTTAAWNGLFAAVQAEIGGADLAGSSLGVGLTAIYGAGAIAPPLFGLLVDHAGFSFAWHVLAVVTLLGIAPALAARRLLRAQVSAA